MISRLIAAGAAFSVTFSLVWSLAALGYPPSGKPVMPLMVAQTCR